MEDLRDTVNHDNSSWTERQDGWMKSGRGGEQHFQPVWKHERGEKGKKGKRFREWDDGRSRGAERREHTSGRHERRWEGRKCGGENRYDYQGNSQNPPPPPAGEEETEECGADKEEKEYGEKKEREWEDSEREKKKKSIEWMLTGSPNSVLSFILHRRRSNNRKHIFSRPGPKRDKKAICILFLFSVAWPVSLPAYL